MTMASEHAAEQAAEPNQEPVAAATALRGATLGPAANAVLRAGTLGGLPNDAARRDALRRVGAAFGNRRAARVVARTKAEKQTLARLVKAADVEKIAKDAKGKPFRAQQLVWELIHLFVPEKGVSLDGSRVEATQVGFRLDGKTIVIGDDVVNRVAAGDTTNVGKDLVATLAPLPDPFKQISAGGVKCKDAPEYITIPRVVQEGAEKAWSKSLPGDKSLEQGGIITEDKSGAYGFTAGSAGTSGTFMPNRGALKKGEKLLGILHTHPYSIKEGAFTDVPFSGQDLGLMAQQKEKFDIVVSGSGWFIVATSKEFEARVKAAPSKNKLHADISKDWDTAFKAATGDTKERALAATPAICLKYELLYYAGHNGFLTMPSDMVKAYRAKP